MAAKKMGQDWKQESDNAPRRLTEWERAIIDGFFMWRLVANLRWVVSFWAIFFHIRQRTKHGTDEVMATSSRPDSFLSGLWLGKSVCSTVDKSDYLCTPSYLRTFRASKKDNFKWFCDSCLTNFEVSKTAKVDDRIGHLVNQVSKMAANMTQLNETVSTLQEAQANASVGPGKESNVSVWNDSKRTQVVKASLLIKPSEGPK